MKPRILQLLLAITLAAAPCVAETGYVTVLVQDAQQHPVRLVEIEISSRALSARQRPGKSSHPGITAPTSHRLPKIRKTSSRSLSFRKAIGQRLRADGC
jgi:hypothetical protein